VLLNVSAWGAKPPRQMVLKVDAEPGVAGRPDNDSERAVVEKVDIWQFEDETLPDRERDWAGRGRETLHGDDGLRKKANEKGSASREAAVDIGSVKKDLENKGRPVHRPFPKLRSACRHCLGRKILIPSGNPERKVEKLEHRRFPDVFCGIAQQSPPGGFKKLNAIESDTQDYCDYGVVLCHSVSRVISNQPVCVRNHVIRLSNRSSQEILGDSRFSVLSQKAQARLGFWS
jgi:hypothetical protein